MPPARHTSLAALIREWEGRDIAAWAGSPEKHLALGTRAVELGEPTRAVIEALERAARRGAGMPHAETQRRGDDESAGDPALDAHCPNAACGRPLRFNPFVCDTSSRIPPPPLGARSVSESPTAMQVRANPPARLVRRAKGKMRARARSVSESLTPEQGWADRIGCLVLALLGAVALTGFVYLLSHAEGRTAGRLVILVVFLVVSGIIAAARR
ncbi:MAG: hypothetical protein HY719_05065 [Planctomycetes bacterium]|nr:hypothetical protein [Planctomycetota bacterium]